MMTYITNSRTSFAAFRVNARTNKRRGKGKGREAKDTNTDHSLNILLRSRVEGGNCHPVIQGA